MILSLLSGLSRKASGPKDQATTKAPRVSPLKQQFKSLKATAKSLIRRKAVEGDAEDFLRHMLEQELEEVKEIQEFLDEDMPEEAEEAMKNCKNGIVRRSLRRLSIRKSTTHRKAAYEGGEVFIRSKLRGTKTKFPTLAKAKQTLYNYDDPSKYEIIDGENKVIYDGAELKGKSKSSRIRKNADWVVVDQNGGLLTTATDEVTAKAHQDRGAGTAMTIEQWSTRKRLSKRRNKAESVVEEEETEVREGDLPDDLYEKYDDANYHLHGIVINQLLTVVEGLEVIFLGTKRLLLRSYPTYRHTGSGREAREYRDAW